MAINLPTQKEIRSKTNSNMNKLQGSTSKAEDNIRLQQAQSFIGSSNDPFSTPTRDNYQTYPYDYYSGADCKIFFGDIWVDDIVGIQYNLSQSKTPIYGYASQYFDAIAKGQVIVQGSLMVAFKETGYLNVIQATLESQRADASKIIKAKIDKYKDDAKTGTAKFIPRLNTIGEGSETGNIDFSFSANGSPQIIRQQQTIEQILADKKVNTSAAISKTLGVENKTRDFEDFAEILEDSLWGDSNGRSIALNNKLKRVDEFDYTQDGGIVISRNGNYSDVLNIMLTFGDINDFRAEHTIIILNDVHFTSTSMIVNSTGDPIGEEYSFIAKTINDSINNNSNVFNIDPIKLNIGTDVTLSKLENINAIETFLNNTSTGNSVEIVVDAGQIENTKWDTISKSLGNYNFNFNKVTPFSDQLCSFVENTINSLTTNNLSTKYLQYVVTAYFGYKSEQESFNNKITMILENSVVGTKSFRVISPTRSGFSAVNIITRDDLFAAKAMEPPKQNIPKINENQKKKNNENALIESNRRKQEEQTNIAQQTIVASTEFASPTFSYAPADATRVNLGTPSNSSSSNPISDNQMALIKSRQSGRPKGMTLAEWNNNPGNLKFAGQAGAVLGEGGFAKFATKEAGATALQRQIDLDKSRDHTLISFVEKYAPSEENDTALYIKQASASLGVAPGTPLKDIPTNQLANFIGMKESSTSLNLLVETKKSKTVSPKNEWLFDAFRSGAVNELNSQQNYIKEETQNNLPNYLQRTTKEVKKTDPSELAKKEAQLTLDIAKINKTDFLGDTTIQLDPELRNLYPNAPPNIKLSSYKNLETTNPLTNETYSTGGFYDLSRGKPKDTGYIALNASRGDAAVILAHELQHAEQFGGSNASINETQKQYFSGPYKNRKGEIEARAAGEKNAPIVYDKLGNIISKYWE